MTKPLHLTPASGNDFALVEEIFHKVLELPPGNRAGALEKLSGGNILLRQEVRSLLSAFESAPVLLSDDVVPLYSTVARNAVDEVLARGEIGGFEVERLINEGGMGAVFLARDPVLNRRVAIKILPFLRSSDTAEIERFRREAVACSAVSHPNVSHVYSFSYEGGLPHIVMEYIDGRSLREVLQEGIPSPAWSIRILTKLADVLEEIHSHGIVHLDLKPENLMITKRGYLKVVDFGLSQTISLSEGDKQLARSIPYGTAAYLPPEYFDGDVLDHRADIWSFGILMFELITGRRPFPGRNAAELAASISEGRFEIPETANSIPGFGRLVKSLLSRDPDARLSNIDALLAELRMMRRIVG